MASLGSLKSTIFDREERKQQYQAHIRGLNAYDRHKKFINDYVSFYGKEKPSNVRLPIKTDQDTLREGYRWRTEKEVISGKGQFICGNKHCDEKDGLASYEVNFCYFEAGENKQALVKLVTCERCARKLNYKRQKEKEQLEKRQQEQDRRKRNRSKSDDDLDEFQESKERRQKGKRATISPSDHKIDDDDNIDEYLEGMFP
ncbi:uncharacterized protein LOC130748039 isoform X2 [Lotus japonicus]|uniref:uncharacterized protein LOC130748039 isoform X2 n=1 Tax=Lotus japonicus TaxID=34305 RepID=UPI00258AADF8|nr:uncharacterized protein LOC130748039 isoform X2 [Lotus japonicus]